MGDTRSKKARRLCATSPRAIELAEKRATALGYRKQGYTYDAIGEAMGITAQYAHELVTGALVEMVREPAEQVICLELARLDDMLTGLSGGAVKGDVLMVDRVLKIGERRAKLLGLDAPEKVDATFAVIDREDRDL